ncbi:MAG: phosphodiester glycosidase family protein [Verrucomicrobiales bacterium]|nr:phosphodiester glycosidase family protein [Verrucomicrobiales bacterium]
MMRHLTLFGILFAFLPLHAETVQHRGTTFHVYRVTPETETVELFLAERKGEPNTFPKLEARLKKQGLRLKFAMNSGIFEGNFLPTGLHISEGKTVTKLNLDDFIKEHEGQLTPNFFLKPNGVFFIRPNETAGVLESALYASANESPRLATQSGPILVKEGNIHPALSPESESRKLRNGVGVDRNGTVIFVCSESEQDKGLTNFYSFAEFFRDIMKCPNALYLDGAISDVYIRGETDPMEEDHQQFAGILAIVEPSP